MEKEGENKEKEIHKINYFLLSLLVFFLVFFLLSLILPGVTGNERTNLDQTTQNMFVWGLITLLIWTVHVSIPIILSIYITSKVNSKILKGLSLTILPIFLLFIIIFLVAGPSLYGILPTYGSGGNDHGGIGGHYSLGEELEPLITLPLIGLMGILFSIGILFLSKSKRKYFIGILIIAFLLFMISLLLIYSSSQELNEKTLRYQCSKLFNYLLGNEYGAYGEDFSLYISRQESGEKLLDKKSDDCKKDLEKQLTSFAEGYTGFWKEKWTRVNETDIEIIRNWASS